MKDFLDSVENFINAAKLKAQDLADTGAKALEELAAWVRSQGAGVMKADPHESLRLADAQTELQALLPAAGTVGSAWSERLVKLLLAVLAEL